MASSAASGPAPSRPPSPPAAGQKVHDASQIKRDSYTDLAAAKISEMMQSSSLDDAPTQSLLRVAYGILDESIQRETGEIPHRDVCLLRNVVQELEHRLGIQADHIRKQNSIIKSRKDKYRTKINALETLVNGANEENEMTVNRFEQMETEMQEHLTTKADIFQSYMDNQKISIKDIRLSSQSIKQEMFALQMKWRDEICNTGNDLKGIVDAADNYHKVLAENQKLFNKVQELKGNIQVYCRVRPFLPGQDGRATTIDYIGESGEILITNPFKQGKDECRMFKFNKVFNTRASQAQVFSDIKPLIRSVIDGFNVCIFAYGQTGSGKTYTMSGPGTTEEDWGINYRALNELFEISLSRKGFSYEVEIQMIEIYNEQVRDLLSNDVEQKRLEINSSQANGLVVPDASLHPVKSKSDVLDLMEIGQTKRAVGSTALNESSSRSHSILIVHVRGLCLKTGSISRGVLQLVDLAGSERAERSEAIGDRLKETQHINKSLSALGDVMFALAQKNAHVPYRNSKLTHVLQSSLGGQAKTVMFVQINPDTESFSETMTTLKFAERVSGVELGAARSNKEGKDIKELLEQVSYLKDTISRKDTIIEQLLKDKSKLPSSSTDTNDSSQQIWRLSGAAGSGEAECEDVSNDGCSVAAEMQNAPARIARLFPTKNGQPGNSKPKPWESALKPQGRTKSTGSQLTGGGSSVQPLKKGSQVTGGGSSVKPLKRW